MTTSFKYLFSIALLFLVCSPKFCQASYVNTLSAMACVDTYIQLIRDGKWEQAYNKSYSREYRDIVSYEEFDHFIRSFGPLKNNKSLELGRLGFIQGGIGIYDGIVTSNEGERLLVRFELVRENGSWRIQQLSLFKPNPVDENVSKEDKREKYKKYPRVNH